MKIFADTADIAAIERLAQSGLIDGVTTNPTLIARSGHPFLAVIKEIAALVDGPVSAEVSETDYDQMMREADNHAPDQPVCTAAKSLCGAARLRGRAYGFWPADKDDCGVFDAALRKGGGQLAQRA